MKHNRIIERQSLFKKLGTVGKREEEVENGDCKKGKTIDPLRAAARSQAHVVWKRCGLFGVRLLLLLLLSLPQVIADLSFLTLFLGRRVAVDVSINAVLADLSCTCLFP